MLVVVVCLFVLALLLGMQASISPRKYKSRKRRRTEMGLVQETQARWKDRPNVPGGFFFMGGIPGLEGSNPGKEVPEGRFSPWVRGAPAPGPQVRGAKEQRSPITNAVLGQASHRIKYFVSAARQTTASPSRKDTERLYFIFHLDDH